MPAPRITAAICTHDRPHYVAQCLEALARQTVAADGFDILVVDSGSPPAGAARLADLAASVPNARLIRLDRPGLSAARNAALDAGGEWVAFLDDDAVAAPDWIAAIMTAIREAPRPPALIGGAALPRWEAPLPDWWPPDLRGILTINEWQGRGAYRRPGVPEWLMPYGVNMILNARIAKEHGGFAGNVGRVGKVLLSDEEVLLAWRMQDAGHDCIHDSRIVVEHCIQARRLTPAWLLERQYWQGISTPVTLRALGHGAEVWRQLPRRALVAMLFLPLRLWPTGSTALLGLRWRQAYSMGFARSALGLVALKPAG